MRSIQNSLAEIQSRGVRVVGISVDTPQENQTLMNKAHLGYPLLSDANAEAIKRYDLLHPAAGPGGKDIARPAEFLIDSSGKVRWVNLTGDFRIRARPTQILQAMDAAGMK